MSASAHSIERHVLLVVNESADGDVLRDAIGDGPITVMVVAPALNSKIRHWISDDDTARHDAAARLDGALAELRGVGIDAAGEVGDYEPLQAIHDALRAFDADEVVIISPAHHRAGVRADLAECVMGRFGLPVAQLDVAKPQRAPVMAQRQYLATAA